MTGAYASDVITTSLQNVIGVLNKYVTKTTVYTFVLVAVNIPTIIRQTRKLEHLLRQWFLLKI